MTKTRKELYRLIAVLLQYPDQAWLQSVPELASGAKRLTEEKARQVAAEFLDYLASKPLLTLQEIYTAAFDLNPATSLNMTFHLLDDGEKRAALLVRLNQGYQALGYDGPAHDLPDFLPAMLEYLAVCPEDAPADLFRQCMAGLEGLVDRLREPAPAYAKLLDLLADDYRYWLQAVAPASCPGFVRFVEANWNQARRRSREDGGGDHEPCQ